eukprot:587954-Pleurochrysis_carterae.AAC.2
MIARASTGAEGWEPSRCCSSGGGESGARARGRQLLSGDGEVRARRHESLLQSACKTTAREMSVERVFPRAHARVQSVGDVHNAMARLRKQQPVERRTSNAQTSIHQHWYRHADDAHAHNNVTAYAQEANARNVPGAPENFHGTRK